MTSEAHLPIKRHYTPEEVAKIAARDHLTRYPKLALRRYKLSQKANHITFRRIVRTLQMCDAIIDEMEYRKNAIWTLKNA